MVNRPMNPKREMVRDCFLVISPSILNAFNILTVFTGFTTNVNSKGYEPNNDRPDDEFNEEDSYVETNDG